MNRSTAEAKALELYPTQPSVGSNSIYNWKQSESRAAFLKCWELMQPGTGGAETGELVPEPSQDHGNIPVGLINDANEAMAKLKSSDPKITEATKEVFRTAEAIGFYCGQHMPTPSPASIPETGGFDERRYIAGEMGNIIELLGPIDFAPIRKQDIAAIERVNEIAEELFKEYSEPVAAPASIGEEREQMYSEAQVREAIDLTEKGFTEDDAYLTPDEIIETFKKK